LYAGGDRPPRLILCFALLVHKAMSRKVRINLLIDTSSDEEEDTKLPPKQANKTAPASSVTPDRGLPNSIKKQLIEVLDSKGGFEAVSCAERVLRDVCDEDIVAFGSPSNLKTPRGRRRQVSNFIDKYKRLTPPKRADRRASIFKKEQASSANIKSLSPTATTSSEVVPKSAVKPTPKKEITSSTAFTMYRNSSKKKSNKGEVGK